ncbi:RNase H domain-containing protein [Trichonephila clavipes]|uniref:RNase H domain-containing protein n=2 Tax=Trichonephila clavipes TaxID=2585209 RepID=A0A8X6S5J1_TRICX|nr:RNase H domain-containing protein [Trichonephila clavipes]
MQSTLGRWPSILNNIPKDALKITTDDRIIDQAGIDQPDLLACFFIINVPIAIDWRLGDILTEKEFRNSCTTKENPVSCNGYPPAHVNIEGNECADSLAKEARDIEHKCTTITLDDANAVAKHRIMNHTFKKPLVTEFDCPRIITSTIARLRTEHLKGMKIHPDKTRSYVQCKHCPDLQLTPNHILECPTVATKLLKMGMVPLRDSLRELLYSPDAPRIAEAVIKTFDGI